MIPSVPAPHPRRKTERPDTLLEAALGLFVERGFAATRMEDVAARAGVSKGTVYLYWPSKEDLLRTVIRQFLGTHLDAGVQRLAAHQGSAVEGLRTLYADWWIEVLRSPFSGVFKLMVAEARNFPDVAQYYRQEVVERGQAVVRELLLRGMARGELRTLDVDTAAFSLLLPMVMLCIHQHALNVCASFQVSDAMPHPVDPATLVRGHIDLLLQGLVNPEVASKIAGFPASAASRGA